MTDKIVPLAVGGFSLTCCLILFGQMIRRPEGDVIFVDREVGGDDAGAQRGLWGTLAWLALLIALTAAFGFIIALMIFLMKFFRLRAGASWLRAALLTACGIVFMCVMAGALNRNFPPGWLPGVIELPWPLT